MDTQVRVFVTESSDRLGHTLPTDEGLATAVEAAISEVIAATNWQLILVAADGLRTVCHGGPKQSPAPRMPDWQSLGGDATRQALLDRQVVARSSADAVGGNSTSWHVPILLTDELLGVLSVQSELPEPSAEVTGQLLNLGLALAPALDRWRLSEEVEVRASQLVLLGEISRRLIGLRPLEERWSDVTPLISQLLDFTHVQVFELVGDRLVLRSASHHMESDELASPDLVLVRQAVSTRSSVQTPGHDGEDPAGETRSQLALPMMVEDRVLGAVLLSQDEQAGFSADDLALAEMLSGQLAISALEAHNYAQQQEYTWFNAVLLEVAKHAALPGEPIEAIRAVLQLTTMLAGARWTLLLTPSSDDTLEMTVSSGLNKESIELLASLPIPLQAVGISPPYDEIDEPLQLDLPEAMAGATGDSSCIGMILSDGAGLLGLLLIGGPPPQGPRRLLLSGIAHQLSLRIENTRLIERLATQRSLERELQTARRIQRAFLPEALPNISNWQVGATWQSARQVGGDFFDFIPLGGGELWGVVVADVADKGVPAALFMALCRTLLRSVARQAASPAEALQSVNELIISDTRAELFVSMIYGVWEPETGRFSYVNAGHNPPLLIDDSGQQWLTDHGMVLGVSDRARYQTTDLELGEGSTLLLYTDGVTEAINPEGKFYGNDRLAEYVTGIQDSSAQSVAESILAEIRTFSGTDDPSDDLTSLVIQRRPVPNP